MKHQPFKAKASSLSFAWRNLPFELANFWAESWAYDLHTFAFRDVGRTVVIDPAPLTEENVTADDPISARLLRGLAVTELESVTWCNALRYEGAQLLAGMWLLLGPRGSHQRPELARLVTIAETLGNFYLGCYIYPAVLRRSPDGVLCARADAIESAKQLSVVALDRVALNTLHHVETQVDGVKGFRFIAQVLYGRGRT